MLLDVWALVFLPEKWGYMILAHKAVVRVK